MANKRILSTEEMVGYGHGTKADTLNRLMMVEHLESGVHNNFSTAAEITAGTDAVKSIAPDQLALIRSTVAEAKTGTDGTKMMVPSAMIGHEGIVKAWIQFTGTGTIAIQDSFNVSGITDNGTGNYQVTWDTNFGNDDYACVANNGEPQNQMDHAVCCNTPSVEDVRVIAWSTVSALAADTVRVYVIAIGDR